MCYKAYSCVCARSHSEGEIAMMSLALAGIVATFVVSSYADPFSFGRSTFIAQGTFPTSVYGRYFNNPTQTSKQVQPVITDPVSVSVGDVLEHLLLLY